MAHMIFIFVLMIKDMFHLKLICLYNNCIILDPPRLLPFPTNIFCLLLDIFKLQGQLIGYLGEITLVFSLLLVQETLTADINVTDGTHSIL